MSEHKRGKVYGALKKYANKAAESGGTLSTIGNIARTALKVARFVATVVNVEKKYFDYSNNPTASTTGGVECLLLITTGTGPTQRIGSSIKATSAMVKGFIDVSGASAVNQTVRVIIFQDQSNVSLSAAPAVGDILEASGSAYSVMSPLSRQYPDRWHIFMDKCFDLCPIGTGSGRRSFKKLIKFKNNPKRKEASHMKWDETGDAQTDTRGGQIYILYVSDQAASTPTVRFYSRTRFIDN